MLERLGQLLPPPEDPVEPGRPDGWAAVEAALGTGLPSDFKAFTERYGSGMVDDFLYLFNPFAAGEDGNLLVEKDRVLAPTVRPGPGSPTGWRCRRSLNRAGFCPLGAPTTVTSSTG
jgi:hypothetical protein